LKQSNVLTGLFVLIAALYSAGCAGMVGPGTPGLPSLDVTPSVSDFGKVPVGTYLSQPIELKASGRGDVTIRSITVTGTDFSVSGLALPVTVTEGQAASFTVAFKPTEAGADSGDVVITSDAKTSATKVPLSGTGVKADISLSMSPAEVDFGDVELGHSKAGAITLKATGNADVEISRISVAGNGFTVSGAGAGTKLAPGQELALGVTFDPSTAGVASGSLMVYSNGANSPTQVRLAGSAIGASGTEHAVLLQWVPSASNGVVGYYIYRSSSETGPFTKVDESADTSTAYTDASVSKGVTYYYRVTAVDSEQVESSYSETVSATIPE
jgi:hypothetical protein